MKTFYTVLKLVFSCFHIDFTRSFFYFQFFQNVLVMKVVEKNPTSPNGFNSQDAGGHRCHSFCTFK